MDILMPQLGETVAEGKITTWFKSIGDAVKPGDNLFEIETDKVSMEVPATSPAFSRRSGSAPAKSRRWAPSSPSLPARGEPAAKAPVGCAPPPTVAAHCR